MVALWIGQTIRSALNCKIRGIIIQKNLDTEDLLFEIIPLMLLHPSSSMALGELPWAAWARPRSSHHICDSTALCINSPAFWGFKSQVCNRELRNPKAQVRLSAIKVGGKSIFELGSFPSSMTESQSPTPPCQLSVGLLSATGWSRSKQDPCKHQLFLAPKHPSRELFCCKFSYLL